MIVPTPNAPYQVAEITSQLSRLRTIAADSTMTEQEKVAAIKQQTTTIFGMIERNERHWLEVARTPK